ncbi:MAG: amino acid ABC transporter permease [Pseudochelatococcus sp.]|jgi:polar amino acid transport system permease protein|uniref:amino acid ABC transporter permease n=1 Tax=Pseudochelatococcus sp. TaxID=2020869 RepID=UPI003D94BFCF
MNYQFQFHYVQQAWPQLLEGLQVTVQLTAIANVIALTLGFGIALLVLSKYRLVRVPFMLLIEFFRCTPVLVQILWFFYCVPILFGIYIEPLPMGILALGLNLACFNAEAYRAAIQSVPREQVDAGVALGFSPMQRIRYVVFPHAFRAALPVLITNGITLFQQSALVALVALTDLMYVGKQVATQTYRPIETYTVVALIYFAIAFPVSRIAAWIEHRLDTARA